MGTSAAQQTHSNKPQHGPALHSSGSTTSGESEYHLSDFKLDAHDTLFVLLTVFKLRALRGERGALLGR